MNELEAKRNSYKYQLTDFTNHKIYYYNKLQEKGTAGNLFVLMKEKKAQFKISNKKPFINKYGYKEIYL